MALQGELVMASLVDGYAVVEERTEPLPNNAALGRKRRVPAVLPGIKIIEQSEKLFRLQFACDCDTIKLYR